MMAIVLLSANLQPQKVAMVFAVRRSGNENGCLLLNAATVGWMLSSGGVSQYSGVGE